MDREVMVKRLKNKLTEKRFIHSLGVEYTAACLAYRYGADAEKARLAGLLHDCAKCIPTDEKLKRAIKIGIPVNKIEKKNPDLLHGKLGAYYAREKYGVTDADILSAITYHTTGHPGMSLLDKIIFVADYIEPNRRIIRDLPEIRHEAFVDLDKCILHILKNTLEYLDSGEALIDEMTEKTYAYYINEFNIKESDKEGKDKKKAKSKDKSADKAKDISRDKTADKAKDKVKDKSDDKDKDKAKDKSEKENEKAESKEKNKSKDKSDKEKIKKDKTDKDKSDKTTKSKKNDKE